MERSTGVQAYYAESAERLGRVYESVSLEDVHGALLDLLPPAPARVLDVGAGTGRDAAAPAGRGYTVDAAEPVAELRRVAERLHPGSGVTWRAGALPEIPGVRGPYDVVLLTAVTAAVTVTVAMGVVGLLLVSALMVVPVAAGLRLLRTVAEGTDRLGRDAVHWHAVALQLG
ncbi:class I SAM-dependent methyltransferase [Streptomyces sp. NPDC091972]|uniref:class I SAM-dependent methyltransferase n=1 Tax=unclassified Streptomyces TaxID=2593676 RepID=UPI00344418EC